MVVGTSEGFAKDLQLIGVGYRGAVNGKTLTMNLGFSHPVVMTIPDDVEVKVACSHRFDLIVKLPNHVMKIMIPCTMYCSARDYIAMCCTIGD